MRKIITATCLSLGVITFPLQASEVYPAADSNIRFVIGFPPGSSIDTVSRIVLEDIQSRTGVTVIVESKPGALGVLGLAELSKAKPDGYTLMPSSSATHSSGPFLSKAFQKYDAINDFTHIGRMTNFDIAIVTNAKGPYGSVEDLVETAKQKPGVLTSGYGSGTARVVAAAFAGVAGIDITPVPYKGQPAALVDLVGGRIDMVASDMGAVMPHIKANRIQAIALVADQRSPKLPDVPTVQEAGLGEVAVRGWIGVAGPANLPEHVVKWWEEQLETSLKNPAVQERLRTANNEPTPLFGSDFRNFVQMQYDDWGKQIKAANIQPE